jgi:peptide subunit release factor 1 (eRF1)
VFDAATGKERFVSHAIEPTTPLKRRVYRCAQTFDVSHVLELFQDHTAYGLVLMSGDEASLYRKCGTKLTVLQKMSFGTRINHHKCGGSSSNRYREIQENQLATWVKAVAEAMNAHFYDGSTHALRVPGGIFTGVLGSDTWQKVQRASALLGPVRAAVRQVVKITQLDVNQLLSKCDFHEHSDAAECEHWNRLQEHLQDASRIDLLVYGNEDVEQALLFGQLRQVVISATQLGRDRVAQLVEQAQQVGCEPVRFASSDPLSEAHAHLINTFGGLVGVRWFSAATAFNA